MRTTPLQLVHNPQNMPLKYIIIELRSHNLLESKYKI